MVAIIPVMIKSINLGSIKLTQDDIHSIDAVNKLTFTVSVPVKDLEAGDILRFKEIADQPLLFQWRNWYDKAGNLLSTDVWNAHTRGFRCEVRHEPQRGEQPHYEPAID